MSNIVQYEKVYSGNKYIGRFPKGPISKGLKQQQEAVTTKDYKIKKEKLLEKNYVAFLLFCVLVLGYVVKDCHKKWAKFIIDSWLAGKKKSMILAPRDHGKSTILTISYVIWRIILNPNIKILIVSNSGSAAKAFLAAIKSHFEKNTVLRNLFGDYVGSKWSEDAIIVSKRDAVGLKEPTVNAVGMFGTIVSGHYDLVIGEDIVDFENSRTQNQRDKAYNWFFTVVYPTVESDELDESKSGEMSLRGTRYHYDDFYGRVLGEVPAFQPGSFNGCALIDSAFVDEAKTIALWPERKSVKTLHEIEADVGSVIFALQYQNNALLTKGRIFTPQYFMNFYKELPDDVIIVAGYDLAVKTKEENDYFAEAIIAADKKHNIYLIDVSRTRITAPKQYEYIKKSHASYKFMKAGIESVAYQEALPQWLRDNTGIPVKSIPRSKDKVTRAYKIQPLFENDKFFMPEGKKFTDFVNEMTLFPDATHDDMFDAIETAISLVYKSDDFSFFFLDANGNDVSAESLEAKAKQKSLIIPGSGEEIPLPEEVVSSLMLSNLL